MPLTKCMCGVYTGDDFSCVNCQKAYSMGLKLYPTDTEEEEDNEDNEERGLTILDSLEGDDDEEYD